MADLTSTARSGFLSYLPLLTFTDLITHFLIAPPPLHGALFDHYRLPRNMNQLRELADVVLKYKDKHFGVVLGMFSAVYIFLQAFAIPGAIFLSILAGTSNTIPIS